MRSLTTFFGSALCAFALLAAPVQAKDKSAGAPAAACKCTADTCKCEKKGKCKCPEASCTCEKCKAIRNGKPATTTPAPAAPAKQIFELNNDIQNHCGKCDKKDDDKEKPATCPSCPSKDPAPAKESINVGNNGKCDKKDCDKDKPATCPDKDSAAAKESVNVGDNGKCDKKDDDKEKPAVCPNCPSPEKK